MVSVSSISANTNQLGLQQARRNADQAVSNAQNLQAEAASAQRVADQAQSDARSLSNESAQALAQAFQAQQSVVALSTQVSVTQATSAVDQATNAQLALESKMVAAKPSQALILPSPFSRPASPGSSPIVNTQGQVTGSIINTTA
jgi:hypothetical protein